MHAVAAVRINKKFLRYLGTDDRSDEAIVKKIKKETCRAYYPKDVITEEFYDNIMDRVINNEKDAKTQAPETPSV